MSVVACGPCGDTGLVAGDTACGFCAPAVSTGKVAGMAERVALDCDELRDIADWFDGKQKGGNGAFLRAVACRYEIVAGAYNTARAAADEAIAASEAA